MMDVFWYFAWPSKSVRQFLFTEPNISNWIGRLILMDITSKDGHVAVRKHIF